MKTVAHIGYVRMEIWQMVRWEAYNCVLPHRHTIHTESFFGNTHTNTNTYTVSHPGTHSLTKTWQYKNCFITVGIGLTTGIGILYTTSLLFIKATCFTRST